MMATDVQPLPSSDEKSPLWPRVVLLVVVAALIAGLWAAFGRRFDSAEEVSKLMRGALETPGGIALIIGGLAAALLVFVPVTALMVACAVVFEPWQAFLLALSGATLGAAGNWGVGRLVGEPLLRRLKGPRWTKLIESLRKNPFKASVVVRFFPVGGFTLLNMVVGAAKVPLGRFLAGSAVGMAPGLVLITLFGGQLPGLFRSPQPLHIALVVVGAVVVVAVTLVVRRTLKPEDEA